MENIINFKDGGKYEGTYIIKDLSYPQDKNGKEYTRFTICDSTGEIQVRQWLKNESLQAPGFIKATIMVTSWNNTLSATAAEVEMVVPTEEERRALIPSSYRDVEEMKKELHDIIMTIKDPAMSKLIAHAMNLTMAPAIGNFCDLPAARGMHHNELHGLLQHTLEMAQNAAAIAPTYPWINRDLLVTGAILHDLSKDEEFEVNELGLVDKYSDDGNLLGHLYMGAKRVAEWCEELNLPPELSRCLQHMILSHHGQREWGAVQLPATPEASALFLIDMMSSRMEMYRKEYVKLEKGQTSDEVNKGLGVRVYKSLYAPDM